MFGLITSSSTNNLLIALHYLSNFSPVWLLIFEPFAKVFLWWRTIFDLAILCLLFFGSILSSLYLHLRWWLYCQLLDIIGSILLNITNGIICSFLMRDFLEEKLHIFLLKPGLLSLKSLVKPVWVLDFRYWVHAFLESRRNCNYLHNSSSHSFSVVVPINNFSHVEILKTWLFEPLSNEFLHNCFFSLKNGSGNSTVSYFGLDWQLWYDELYI